MVKRSKPQKIEKGSKELSNPFSTGGGGSNFENQIQAIFVVLMLTGGIAPCLPPGKIKKIKLQGRYAGYNTDDFIVYVENLNSGQESKLLAQIKHAVSITENDATFSEVIEAAWSDFQNTDLFDPNYDVFALISGPLSAQDTENARTILEWARHSETALEFIEKVNLANFSSEAKRNKLKAFKSQLKKANNGKALTDDELWKFLKRFHLLGYDLDIRSGAYISLIMSLISQHTNNIAETWATVSQEVASFNQNAGTITMETISAEVKNVFSQRIYQTVIPDQFLTKSETSSSEINEVHFAGDQSDALVFASLLGAWNDRVEGDREVISELIKDND